MKLIFSSIQGSYWVLNTWKSMEFNFLLFKAMNSMKFRVAVWKSMDLNSKLLYASIFLMQFDQNFFSIYTILYQGVIPGIFLYFHFVTLFNALCLCISNADFSMEFYIFWY